MIKHLKPSYITSSVLDMNIEILKNDGIKGILFDLDNTIMEPKAGVLKPEIQNWLENLEKEFKIAVVSNNTNVEYLEQVKNELNYSLHGFANKPNVKVTAQALKELGLLPSQVAMVGDRPLTDIWVGQRLGMTTVLVDPLRKHQENAFIKFLRWLERTPVARAERDFF